MQQKSLTDKFTEYDIVEVLNPTKEDFVGKIATEVVDDNVRRDKTMERLNLRNKSHTSRSHVINTVTIPTGKAVKMPGHVARVVVTQLVNKIMQEDKAFQQMGDKALRLPYEEKVVLNSEKFNKTEDLLTAEERFQRQLSDLNETPELTGVENEKPFADRRESAEPITASPAKTGTVTSPKSAK